MQKIRNDDMYKQYYSWREVKKPFMFTIVAILVMEVLHMIVCVSHIYIYLYKHKHQLFRRRIRRRSLFDGEIYDYDPDDYEMERVQHHLSSHPPAYRFNNIESYFIQDKVLRIMNTLPQFELTVSILLQNLRPKKGQYLSVVNQSQIQDMDVSKDESIMDLPKPTMQTESKNPMLEAYENAYHTEV